MGISKEIVKLIVKNIDKYTSTNLYPNLLTRNSTYYKNDFNIPKDIICTFVHLSRTGGITFNSVLSKISKEKNVKFVLGGHNSVSILHDPEERDYVTIFRNPIERVYSVYKANLRDKKHTYHYLAKKGLNEFLRFCPDGRNGYCQNYSGFIEREVDDFIFNKALKNLKKFKFILNFENLIDEIKKFSQTFGCDIENVPHLNSSEKSILNEEVKKKIEFYNFYDLKLLNEIKKNFNNF